MRKDLMRESKNVIDARRLSRETELTNRSMASGKLKSKTPLKRQHGSIEDAIEGMINNPGRSRSLLKKRNDPAPQKLKKPAAKKGVRRPSKEQKAPRRANG